MRLLHFLVMMRHPDTGVATPIASMMAETGQQANRRAKALYTDDAWAVVEASHAADDGYGEQLIRRFWKQDKKWRGHHFDDED